MIWIKNRVAINSLLVLAGALLAALLFWTMWSLVSTGKGPTPAVSAQELLFTACERTAETDFDFVTTIHGNQNLGIDDELVTITYDAQVSGEDFYLAISDGERAQEVMMVDGAVYYKDPGGAWTLAESQSKMDITTMLSGYEGQPPSVEVESDNPLCPEIGPVARVGEETVSEVSADHYRLTDTGVGAPDGPTGQVDENTYITKGLDITWDYWLNEDGQILKIQEVITLTGDTDAGQVEVTTEVSGIGDPNVITVPATG